MKFLLLLSSALSASVKDPPTGEPLPSTLSSRKTMVVTGGDQRNQYIASSTGTGQNYAYSNMGDPTAMNTQPQQLPSVKVPANHSCYTNCMANLNAQKMNQGPTFDNGVPNPNNPQLSNDPVDQWFGSVNNFINRSGQISNNLVYNMAATSNNAINMQNQMNHNMMTNQQALTRTAAQNEMQNQQLDYQHQQNMQNPNFLLSPQNYQNSNLNNPYSLANSNQAGPMAGNTGAAGFGQVGGYGTQPQMTPIPPNGYQTQSQPGYGQGYQMYLKKIMV